MKRGPMLNCADVDVARYTVLNARDQTTFAMSEEEGSNKHTNYGLRHAFELRLTVDLIGGEAQTGLAAIGIAPSFAARALSNALGRGRAEGIDLAAPGTYAGVVVFETIEGDGSALRFTRWFCQNIGMLDAWLAILEQKENATAVRVFLVNTARAAAFVRKRAEDLGLPEASDEI